MLKKFQLINKLLMAKQLITKPLTPKVIDKDKNRLHHPIWALLFGHRKFQE